MASKCRWAGRISRVRLFAIAAAAAIAAAPTGAAAQSHPEFISIGRISASLYKPDTGPAPHVAFVGDSIFAGSMGGAPAHGPLAKQKVRDQILSLPADTLLCPGHGPLTTVAEEKAHNPFFI